MAGRLKVLVGVSCTFHQCDTSSCRQVHGYHEPSKYPSIRQVSAGGHISEYLVDVEYGVIRADDQNYRRYKTGFRGNMERYGGG